MKIKKHIKKIIAIGIGAIFIGATLTGCVQQSEVSLTQAQYNAALDSKYNAGVSSVDIKRDNAGVIADAKASVDITTDNQKAVDNAVADITVDQVPDAIQQKIIEDAKEVEVEVDAKDEAEGYDLDELEIGAEFNVTISDRKLSGLFDDEVIFDGDEYSAEEVITLLSF